MIGHLSIPVAGSSRSGYTPEGGGTCWLHRVGGQLEIKHADPYICIRDETLRQLFVREPDNPWITLARPTEGHGSPGHMDGDDSCHATPGMICFKDTVLRIKGANRTVIYRIGDYVREMRGWEARWPD